MNIAKQNIYQRDTALYSWPTFFKISVFFLFFSSWKLISQFIHRISNFKNPPFLSSYNIPFLMHMLYHGWMDLDQNSEWHLWLKKKRNDVIYIARPRISILRVLNAAKINRTKKKKKRENAIIYIPKDSYSCCCCSHNKLSSLFPFPGRSTQIVMLLQLDAGRMAAQSQEHVHK